MWHLETWFSGGRGSVRFGLDNLKGLVQTKRFCDSMMIICPVNFTLEQTQNPLYFISFT